MLKNEESIKSTFLLQSPAEGESRARSTSQRQVHRAVALRAKVNSVRAKVNSVRAKVNTPGSAGLEEAGA
jgi:hypothetical protein